MKTTQKLAVFVCMLFVTALSAQDKKVYEKAGDLVKVTYYFDNGKVKQEGFFKDKKLTGTWKLYNEDGKKIAIANYENGKKVGKWFFWDKNAFLNEVNYENNIIADVKIWKEEAKLAVK